MPQSCCSTAYAHSYFAMSAASAAETSTQLPPSPGRVFFQTPPGVGCAGSSQMSRNDPVQKKQGKVTVKYDRKELRKRLILEEWIIEQLSELYDCEEEEMPEVEIDIDDLLEVNSEDERAVKLQESLTDCYKPTDAFVQELLGRIRVLQTIGVGFEISYLSDLLEEYKMVDLI